MLYLLQLIFPVDCIPTCAITGEGLAELISKIPFANKGEYEYDEKERWHEVGNIVSQVERITHRHHTFSEKLADASIHPVTGIPIALIILYAAQSIPYPQYSQSHTGSYPLHSIYTAQSIPYPQYSQ